MTALAIPPVDTVPAEARVPADLLDVLRALDPVQLAVALSLCHPASPQVCAARLGAEMAGLRHGAAAELADASRDVAAAWLATGMRTEPVRRVQAPREQARCDACHHSLPWRAAA